MCLILFAYDAHPRFRLVIAANRDEHYARPSRAAQFWSDAPFVLGGRDVEQGGTWLGITRTGRWAAITNFREASPRMVDPPSRGRLVSDYLLGSETPSNYTADVAARGPRYNGFNLLCGDAASVRYVSNRGGPAQTVVPGMHGLSNHLLDTPWPKVRRGVEALATLGDGALPVLVERLFATLADRGGSPDEDLPDTGIGLPGERRLSPAFIPGDAYGTRASTVVLVDRDGTVTLAERAFGPGGQPLGSVQHSFVLEPADRIVPSA